MLVEIVLVILIVAGYFAYQHYKEKKEFEEYTKEYNLTLEELGQYNGVANKKIFVCIKGDIFDVSNSPFYSQGNSYHVFAGKEATTSLAKGDLEGKFLNTPGHQLTEEEQSGADDWHQRFMEKYRKVGKLRQ